MIPLTIRILFRLHSLSCRHPPDYDLLLHRPAAHLNLDALVDDGWAVGMGAPAASAPGQAVPLHQRQGEGREVAGIPRRIRLRRGRK